MKINNSKILKAILLNMKINSFVLNKPRKGTRFKKWTKLIRKILMLPPNKSKMIKLKGMINIS